MKKMMMTVLVLLWGSSSLASADYVGSWCNSFRYDDYIEVLQINDKDQVWSFGIGKQAHELSSINHGYVSRGANSFLLTINGVDQGITSYRVKKLPFTGKRILILNNKLIYKDCGVKK